MTTKTLVKKIERLDPILRDVLVSKLISVMENHDRFVDEGDGDSDVWETGWEEFNRMLHRLFPNCEKGRSYPAILDLIDVYYRGHNSQL